MKNRKTTNLTSGDTKDADSKKGPDAIAPGSTDMTSLQIAKVLREIRSPFGQALLFEAAEHLEGKQQMRYGRALRAAAIIRRLVSAA